MTAEIFAHIPARIAGARNLRGDDIRVLVAIATHANKFGRCHPSLSRIGSLTGIDRHNVPRSISRLEEAGFIRRQRVRTKTGRWDRSQYQILFNRAGLEDQEEQTVEMPPEQKRQEGGAIANKMLAVWEAECGDTLSVPRKLDRARIAACVARFNDSFNRDLEQWRALCREIRASVFCCGGGRRGWKADFDWALKPRSIRNLLEGNYRDNGSPPRGRAASSGAVSFDDYVVLPLGPGGT